MVYCGKCEFCVSGRHELCESTRELGQQWDGGFAEYMAIPKEAIACGSISKIPEGMKDEYAVLSEPASSCVHAQEKAGIGMGDTVLVIGRGPIGCMHISFAKARGAKCVIVAEISAERLELCLKFGVDITINSSVEDLIARIAQITNGKGVEVVITANPVGSTQVQALEVAKKGGRVVFFGGLPKSDSRPGIDTNLIHYKGLHIIGISTFNPRHYRLAIDAIASGMIPAQLLITHLIKLDDFEKGVELAKTGKALKVVILP
jgi:L-iditol 2-dehydrogenase